MRCVQGFDADDVALALRGELSAARRAAFEAHRDACDACKRAANVLTTAKRAWDRAIERDDAFAGAGREQRLASAAQLPRMHRGRMRFALVGAACGVLAVLAW